MYRPRAAAACSGSHPHRRWRAAEAAAAAAAEIQTNKRRIDGASCQRGAEGSRHGGSVTH